LKRKAFVTKRKEGTVGWWKLRIDELYDLYPSPKAMSVVKSRWAR
jgi:hypothetical protein